MPLIRRSMTFRSVRLKLSLRMNSVDLLRTPIILMRKIGLCSWERVFIHDCYWYVIASGVVTRFGSSLRVGQTDVSERAMRGIDMREHYDFSDSVKNPYARKLKKQVTIRLDEDTIAYFKELAAEKDLPYQSLINLYLRDCAQTQKDLKLEWR